jgi:hypothetical protein
MAIAAVEPELSDVNLMTVRHRLLRRIAHVGKLGREIVPDDEDGHDTPNKRSPQRQERKYVGGLRKNLRHSGALYVKRV